MSDFLKNKSAYFLCGILDFERSLRIIHGKKHFLPFLRQSLECVLYMGAHYTRKIMVSEGETSCM